MAIQYLKRRDMYLLRTPVELPEDVERVEVDQYPAKDGAKQLRFVFYKSDGSIVTKTGALGELTETGLTITLS